MRWVENIDSELKADDQRDMSGRSNAPPQPHDHTPMDDSDTENDEKKENPFRTFAEKVTIAGLEEAYKAEQKPVKIMFRLALIVAFAMIIYEANVIADRYREKGILIQKEINEQPPFPNISICFSPSMNMTANLEKIDGITIPARLTAMMGKFNTSFSDMLHFIQGAMSFNMTMDDMHKPLTLMTAMLFEALREQKTTAGSPEFDILEYPCWGRISNCTFDKQSTDCCQFVQYLNIWQKRCINLQPEKMKKIEVDTEGNGPAEFTFHAMIDWEFAEEIMPDGFTLFVGKMPSFHQVPITVPSGMDVVVTLAQPKEIHENEDCYNAEDAPKLKYFDYYDQEGINCLFEEMNDFVQWGLGCKPAAMSYVPLARESCSFSQLCAMLLTTTGEPTGNGLTGKQDRMDGAFKFVTSLTAGRNSRCKPLCTRWINPVHSTSFSRIDYSNGSETQVQMQNKSWSRIRVIMPDTTYIEHQEMKIKASYLTMCYIGGMMGAYAGFSAVTLFQIIVYGSYVVWWKCTHRKKVQALEDT